MSEAILMALVQLFAIVAASGKKILSADARGILASYLGRHLNSSEQEEYLKLFDELFFFHQPDGDEIPSVKETTDKISKICLMVNRELKQRDKIIVFLNFIEFLQESFLSEMAYYEAIAESFNFEREEFSSMMRFMKDPLGGPAMENLLVISGAGGDNVQKKIIRENLDGHILILHLHSVNTFISRYQGNDTLLMNGHLIYPNRSFFFDNGDILKGARILPVYYSDIARHFLIQGHKKPIWFTVKEAEFHFRNSMNGLQPASFTAESGELVGVMGGSGAGKTTLLNILNGNINPQKGTVTINGYDLYKDREALRGVIGFVPQDDLLIEELSVYRNLYYTARLCFADETEDALHNRVISTLRDIDLLESRDLRVGDPLNKTISGGQRKRLNIALELIRQPSILFADEPTSGLSSMDSEMVMTLLKEQTLGGRLVIVNIHQPSSDIFKLFDKLLILDKGGYPVYYGNPVESLTYFKKISNYVNPEESECLTCGYVNPEQVLQIIESKLVNESGKLTQKRKMSPPEWYGYFRKKIQPELIVKDEKGVLPDQTLKIPSLLKQFHIFSMRNLLTKISNRQYMIITLAEAPLLSALLAFLTRYRQEDTYIFGNNPNLVAFLFMSVVVSIFLGMMVSAEEIIRDRKLLKREAFLHLSRFSYLNSKVIFLFVLSAVQTVMYVVTGNLILGIKEMTLGFCLVLFSTSCVANLIGLNISAGLNTVVAIYITIPFIIVPQLLLSGTVVPFDKLNPSISSGENVPVIGDMMISRWSFEALAVEQFKNNAYEKLFFSSDKEISKYAYITTLQIPRLNTILDECYRNVSMNMDMERCMKRINIFNNEMRKLVPSAVFHFSIKKFNENDVKKGHTILDSLSVYYSGLMAKATAGHDRIYSELSAKYGDKGLQDLRGRHYNEELADLVLNRTALNKIIEGKGKLIRKKDPVLMVPESKNGRAHFYAPVKRLGNLQIDTLWFNVGVLWIMSVILYFMLLTDVLGRTIRYFGSLRFRE